MSVDSIPVGRGGKEGKGMVKMEMLGCKRDGRCCWKNKVFAGVVIVRV